MRILFFGHRFTHFRNFDSVLRDLAARGHTIHLAIERETDLGRPLVNGLIAEFPGITYSVAPGRAHGDWTWVASRLRHGLEYLRYQHSMFDATPMLRERSRERTPGLFITLADSVIGYARWLRRPVSGLLRWLERSIPDDPAIRTFLEDQRPDVVLVTPLVTLGSFQIDYLRAARALGVPTALCVWSWDHLSSKALIRELPDRVFVWNDTQKHEAMDLHRVPADRIVVTGAQCFDKWFGRSPSRDREAFCRAVGLSADTPIILYVCSAPFIGSAPEAPFVVDWIRRVRSHSSPRLRDAAILVRPHPSRRPEWETVDMTTFPNVVVWGSDPVSTNARADYFDSLFHSSLVVGLNTSAFIEAGILGRPVHTILLPEWYENQMGTVHFRYLFEAGGGLLTSATDFDEHLTQLEEGLAQGSTEIRPFVRAFVRPRGLEVAATPIFVEHVERMLGLRVRPLSRPVFPRLALRLLNTLIGWRLDVQRERWVYSERELERIMRMRTARLAKHADKHKSKRELKERREIEQQRELEEYRAAKKARQG